LSKTVRCPKDENRIVSNPYERAVSSFISATIRDYEDKLISGFLGREITPENRFTFREFVNYLNNIDLDKCEIHHRLQSSDFERFGLSDQIHLVHLNNSMEEIPRLEKQLNLSTIDLGPIRKSRHHRPKYQANKFMGDVRLNHIFMKRNADVPSFESFYDKEILELVAEAYHEDFNRYNFDSNRLPEK
jgi:hypothetical protein